ncbi:MAG: Gfo/Idh/MocA family oxidoreductase, partial [Pseudomonadota bacterium]
GAGAFATYHASKVAAHPRCELTGIYDRSGDRAEALAARHDSRAFDRLEPMAEASDALIVAIPSTEHSQTATAGLARGCHLLVEKPLAPTVSQAERIVAKAAQVGRVLQVGHQERIVLSAIGLDRIAARPTQIDIVRHGPPSRRNLDASVVMDLMIHDLDLLGWLFGHPDWISTESARTVYSGKIDTARAEMGFGETTAYVSASRDAEPERRWILRYENGTLEIDFGRKTLRHDTPFDLDAEFGSRPIVQDSLGAAFDRFVRACLDGEPVLATGEEGLAAVRVAAQIEGVA